MASQHDIINSQHDSKAGAQRVLNVDENGAKFTPATEETLQSMADPTALYKLSDVDEGEPTYMGYVKSDGGWYIARIENGTTFRYARGSSGYNWSNRAEKEYNTFNNIFS